MYIVMLLCNIWTCELCATKLSIHECHCTYPFPPLLTHKESPSCQASNQNAKPPQTSVISIQQRSSVDMATNIVVPRFLLPQSSWKVAVSVSRALAQPLPRLRFSSPFPRRRLTTRVHQFHYSSHSRPSIHALHHSSYQSIPHSPLIAAVRAFSTTQNLARDHHFDTLKFVQRLKDEGFSEEQSKAMMLVLSDVIEESIQNLTRTMVLREGSPFLFSSALLHMLFSPLSYVVLQLFFWPRAIH